LQISKNIVFISQGEPNASDHLPQSHLAEGSAAPRLILTVVHAATVSARNFTKVNHVSNLKVGRKPGLSVH
jgi:hypothetical protein